MTETRENVTTGVTLDAHYVMPAIVLRNALAAALVATGKGVTLPTLRAVQVSWEGDRLAFAATDRYRLCVVEWEPSQKDRDGLAGNVGPESGSFLIDRDDVARIVKALPSKVNRYGVPLMVTVIREGASWRVESTEGGTTGLVLDGDFPKWHTLVPSAELIAASEGVQDVAYNPAYLADVARVAGHVLGRNTPVRFQWTERQRPMVAVLGRNDEPGELFARYLLMPVRLVG